MPSRSTIRGLAFGVALIAAASLSAAGQNTISGYDETGTILIGDSVGDRWTDFPQRSGLEGYQACILRLNLGTLISRYPSAKRLLIEAGTNDLLQGPGSGFDCQLPNQDANTSILDMIHSGQAHGLDVYVLSILPITGWNNRAGQPAGPLVVPFNTTLKPLIIAAGAHWVDGYDALSPGGYQGDGVHPSPQGYHILDTVYASTICSVHSCNASATASTLQISTQTITRPQAFTVTAVATSLDSTPLTGSFQFWWSNGTITTVPAGADGRGSLTIDSTSITPGSYQVSALYLGDSKHLMSWSPILSATVK